MPRLSIIIPTLNEAEGIVNLLTSLSSLRQRGHEVIVADGGSHDGTVELARPLADAVIAAPRGRAAQMNAGAAQAKSEVLLFLHADTRLPDRADGLILEQLALSDWVEGRAANTLLSTHEGRLGCNVVELNRHSGMDRRNPDCRDAGNPHHPWSLGSGGPCRNDEGIFNSTSHVWGRFDVRIEGRHPLLPVVAWFMNRRSRWTGIATGDQAMFISHQVFRKVGGFPDIPLMEDIALSKILNKITPPLCLRSQVVTSGRRWEQHGVLRTVLKMWRLRLAFFLGADPARLAKAYGYEPPKQ